MTSLKKPLRLPELDEVVARDAVARVRERLVVGPGVAAQVEERLKRAVPVDDDVGEVDGPAAVALALEHRRGDRDGRRDALTLELDVGQAADEADLVLVLRAGLVVGLDDELGLDPEAAPHLVGDGLVDRHDVGREEGAEAQSVHSRSLPHDLPSAGRTSVSRSTRASSSSLRRHAPQAEADRAGADLAGHAHRSQDGRWLGAAAVAGRAGGRSDLGHGSKDLPAVTAQEADVERVRQALRRVSVQDHALTPSVLQLRATASRAVRARPSSTSDRSQARRPRRGRRRGARSRCRPGVRPRGRRRA